MNTIVLFSTPVTFVVPVLVQFPSNPWFLCRYSWFLLRNISSVCHHRLLHAQYAKYSGLVGGGGTGGEESFADSCPKLFWRKNYCANPRPDDGSQSGSRTRNSISTDHAWLWNHDWNLNPPGNPSLYAQNWFTHFCCHESTQIRKYDQGLSP